MGTAASDSVWVLAFSFVRESRAKTKRVTKDQRSIVWVVDSMVGDGVA